MNVVNISKERFLEAKKKIIHKYPNARTIMDSQGKYYVATEDGRDICNLQIGNSLIVLNLTKQNIVILIMK